MIFSLLKLHFKNIKKKNLLWNSYYHISVETNKLFLTNKNPFKKYISVVTFPIHLRDIKTAILFITLWDDSTD